MKEADYINNLLKQAEYFDLTPDSICAFVDRVSFLSHNMNVYVLCRTDEEVWNKLNLAGPAHLIAELRDEGKVHLSFNYHGKHNSRDIEDNICLSWFPRFAFLEIPRHKDGFYLSYGAADNPFSSRTKVVALPRGIKF